MTGNILPADGAFVRLHVAGWSIGEEAIRGPDGPAWRVVGTDGRRRIRAEASTRDGALWQAVEQVAAGA